MGKKVAELEGAELDYWVAKADGAKQVILSEGSHPVCFRMHGPKGKLYFCPSTLWEQGGPIIERKFISCVRTGLESPRLWEAWIGDGVQVLPKNGCYYGNTSLIAAMRAFVASRFGEEVED